MNIVELAPDLWRVEGAHAKLPLGSRLPVAATVVRLPDRTLAIYSPIAFDDATAAALAQHGEVAHLIAPNNMHHVWLGEAIQRWSRATVHAPAGLAARRSDLRIDRTLGVDPEPAFGDALALEHVGGAPTIAETVAFHRDSGTLLCADLVFNLTGPLNVPTRMVLSMMGARGQLAQSRAWKLFFTKDQAAAAASAARIVAWPIQRLSPCHGEPLVVDAATLGGKLRPMGFTAGAS